MKTSNSTLATMLRTSARLIEEASTLLSQSTPAKNWERRQHIEDQVSAKFERVAELDKAIIATRGSPAEGVEKIRMARDLARDDHRLEVFFAYLESGLADILGTTTPSVAVTRPAAVGSLACES